MITTVVLAAVAFVLLGMVSLAVVSLAMSLRRPSVLEWFEHDDQGRPVLWARDHLPIRVVFHGQLELHWRATARGALMRFNLAIGRSVFVLHEQLGTSSVGHVIISPSAKLVESGHHWHGIEPVTKDGHVLFVSIKVPHDAQNRMALMVHQLGHALGLDHVDDTGSFMFPRIEMQSAPGMVRGPEVQALRRVYG